MGRGVNPTFYSQMSTPDHPTAPNCIISLCLGVLVINKHYCKIIGVEKKIQWLVTHSDKMQTTRCSQRPALGKVAPLSHQSKPGLTLKSSDWKSWTNTDGYATVTVNVFMVHASPGFHLFQDGNPPSLAFRVPWHGRVLTLQPGPNLQKAFGIEKSQPPCRMTASRLNGGHAVMVWKKMHLSNFIASVATSLWLGITNDKAIPNSIQAKE